MTTKFVAQEIGMNIDIEGHKYEATEMETDSSRYNEADMAKAVVVPVGHDEEPDFDDEIKIDINDERVFTGTISEARYKNDGSYKLTAFDDVLKLKNTEVTLSIGGLTPISKIVEIVCEKAGIDSNVNLPWFTGAEGGAVNYYAAYFGSEPAADILDKMAKWSRGMWWVNERNQLQFGNPNTELIEAKYVIDADAGKITPPYMGVKVVGDDRISNTGYDFKFLPSKRPIVEKRAIEYDEEIANWKVVKDSLNTPIFTVKDKQIHTKEQAKATADALIRELLNQVKGGWVKFVGNQDTSKLDVIQMPEIMGGEKYLVGRVQHIVDSNGFITKVECEGLMPDDYYTVAGVGNRVYID